MATVDAPDGSVHAKVKNRFLNNAYETKAIKNFFFLMKDLEEVGMATR